MLLASVTRTLWEVYGEPLAGALGLYQPKDRSYGRCSVPFSNMEKRLYEKNDVEISFHKVMLENGKDWVWYQVWQDPVSIKATGRNADMIFVHGTGVHSGTLASQCRRYLDAGFRLIVPDLPSHGYSSGLHVYQKELRGYTRGLHAVLHDVAARDQRESSFPHFRPTKLERKKTFMLGLSFGGLVAFSYGLHYPASYRYEESDQDEIPIDGLIGVGPMVQYDPKNVAISAFLRIVLMVILFAFYIGRLEVLVPHKKCVDKDPKVYEQLIMQDPRSHQGAFRLGHMYCIDQGMYALQKYGHQLKQPIYVQMGGQDRCIDNDSTLRWMRSVSAEDKRYEMYPVCQHVIYKKAKNEHDDLAGRVAVINDNIEWMCERSPVARRRPSRKMSYASELSSLSRSTSATSLFDRESFFGDDSDSICTTLSTTPSIPDSHSPFKLNADYAMDIDVLGKRLALGLDNNKASENFGWKKDDKGERRLYRLHWEYREDTRPYLLDPYQA